MKNATKHADDLRSLVRRLFKEYKPEPMQKLDPLKALVKGAMSFDVSDARADEAMRLIDREFVDLNELRVATDLEIQELLGTRYPTIEIRVAMITQALNAIFEKEHTLNLDRLSIISKRDGRSFMRDLPEIHPFVEAYVMLFAFEDRAVPLDDAMLAWLRQRGIFDEAATLQEAQRFIEHHFKADECHNFYIAVRKAAHDEGEKNKAPARTKAAAAAKARGKDKNRTRTKAKAKA